MAEQEIAVLDRVLHRLVITEDDKLSAVLDKLLPKLLRKLNDAPAVRAKVVDVLSHISKRARPNPSIILPCAELLVVCRDVPTTSFAFNFSLTFLEMAVPRLRPAEQGAVGAQIARGISRLQRYSTSQNILLNLLLVVLEHLPLRFEATAELPPEDLDVVADWFLDVCLYPGILTREGSAYYGLSPAGLARLTSKEKVWPTDLITRRKIAVVRALKSDLFTPAAAVTPAVAAACSSHHEVVKAAEDLLKSLSSSDRNGALRKDAAVASSLMNLVLGGSGNKVPQTGKVAGGVGAEPAAETGVLSSARSPLSSALAVRALAWLEAECPEGTAARVPEAVRVSFQALFTGVGAGSNVPRAPGAPHHDRTNAARFQAAGARMAAFIAARCNAAMLPIVSPLLLQAVQRVLTMNAAPATSAVGDGGSKAGRAIEAPSVGTSLTMQIQHAAMLEACYEVVASLAVRRPELFSGDTSVPRLLFSELSAKEPALRVKISAALGALKSAYRGADKATLTSEIWSLLWGAAASTEYRARLCAVEWSCDLFNFSDVAARRLCVSLCDDKVTAVRSAASRGLHPQSGQSANTAAVESGVAADSKSSRHPTFQSFVLGALSDDYLPTVARGGGAVPVGLQDFPHAALARALDFALDCHRAHAGNDSSSFDTTTDGIEDVNQDNEKATSVFLSLIEETLLSAPSATDGHHGHAQMVLLHRSAAVALQKLAAGEAAEPDSVGVGVEEEYETASSGAVNRRSAPVNGVAAKLASRGPWLQQWLGHEGSTAIREAFAETAGAAAEFMDPNVELVPLLKALEHKLKPCTTQGAVGFSNRAVSSAHGAACAVGAILSRLATHAKSGGADQPPSSGAWKTLSEDALPSALSSVVAAIGHPVSLLHVAACGAVGRVGAATPLPVCSAGDGSTNGTTEAVAASASSSGEGRTSRGTTVQAVFERLWVSCKLGETTDASRRAEAAAEALGKCCRGAGQGLGSGRQEVSARVRKTLLVLFEMAKNQKEEELQFAVGAAVADLARSGPLVVPAGKVLEGMRVAARAARRKMKEEVVPETGGGQGKSAEGCGAVVDALDFVLHQVLYVLLDDHSPHVSGAAAVYLLAVVQRCMRHPVLAAYLPDVQAAFTRKLTVRSEFVQEVAGRGLALVYQAAGSESKQGLVDSLVDALSTGRRRTATGGTATGGVDVHGATHAGAALSEAGAGAYGEMCAVANDVGRPDLIYSFLSMASHHAAWTTRRGASFGLGAIVNQVSAGAFGEQLGHIVPRLFRYRFDPSAKTRSAMEQLWRSVVGGGSTGGDFSSREKEVIRTNLSAIVKELLRALSDRKWRDRQSACAGLSDVLRGRGWDEIGPHLEELLTMADRALDDIKESVAEAAVDFSKTLSNVSVRLCDPYSFFPPHGSIVAGGDAAETAATAAQNDAAGQGPEALREEAGETRRAIGTMMEDLRSSEVEARARGEEGTMDPQRGGLASGEERDAAADEVLRRALGESGRGGGAAGGTGAGIDAGVGRVLGGRNGPTVEEILRPGRAGAERTGPPPSAPAREAAAGAVAVTLPWLLRKGILSRCKASQGLAMRTLQRLVKVCGKEALMPHLAELVATLIEGLSALEPQALQYMQFHAETQLEMTQDQMERLRLSVSRAGPLQDALDKCYRYLDSAGVVEDLMPRLLGLLRSGTGLATRSASAYLVLSLCERAPMEVRRAAPRLLPTLTNTALSERSSTLRRTYSSALSSVARLAPAAGVSRLASRLAQMFREADPDFDKRQRRTLALLLGDLCRRAGGQLGAGAGGSRKVSSGESSSDSGGDSFVASGWAQIMPVAFVARHDPDKPVADAFEEAWEEGLTQLQLGAAGLGEASRVRTAKDAVLLMLPAVLTEVSMAVSSVSRITKRQGCSGLKDLASTLGPALGEASSGRRLIRRVLSQIHGRTWEGKEELLEAVVALCAAGKGSAVTIEPFIWGESSSGAAGRGVFSSSRGVKRNRISEPLQGGEEKKADADETEAEGGEQEDEDDEEESVAVNQVGSVSDGGRGKKTAAAKQPEEGPAAHSEEGSAAEDEDADSADGKEDAFEYEDKLGDLDDADSTGTLPGIDGDSLSLIISGQENNKEEASGLLPHNEPKKDSLLETEMASLDMEDDSPVAFGDVVALMLAQLKRKNLKFRRAAAVSLAGLLNTFPECCVYDMVAPALLDFACLDGPRLGVKDDPIMQARTVACLAAAWPRAPHSVSSSVSNAKKKERPADDVAQITAEAEIASRDETVYNVQRTHAVNLARELSAALRRKVWSVRVPIFQALAALVSRSYVIPLATSGNNRTVGSASAFAPVLTSSLLADVVQAVELGAEDAKYSQVRAAALSVAVAMTSRKELRLALTPHKEGLMKAARAAAEDPEPKVAVEGSKAVQNLSWWP